MPQPDTLGPVCPGPGPPCCGPVHFLFQPNQSSCSRTIRAPLYTQAPIAPPSLCFGRILLILRDSSAAMVLEDLCFPQCALCSSSSLSSLGHWLGCVCVQNLQCLSPPTSRTIPARYGARAWAQGRTEGLLGSLIRLSAQSSG